MSRRCLLSIDWQRGFRDEAYWGPRNNRLAEMRASALLDAWRARQWPIAHVRHASITPGSPLRRDTPGFAFEDGLEPRVEEPVFEKSVNSAFVGTGLADWLDGKGISRLTLMGVTTDHCVSTSARWAANLGYAVDLCADACFTHARRGPNGETLSAEVVHAVGLASLDREFARVLDVARAIAAADAQA